MSPRKATDVENNAEDLFSDEDYENWETISEEFGTKIEWNIGTRFVGVFTGVRDVEQAKDDGGFEVIQAAEFTRNGEKFYSWQPFALKQAIEKGTLKPGQTVFIHCTGEASTKKKLNPVKVFNIKVKP